MKMKTKRKLAPKFGLLIAISVALAVGVAYQTGVRETNEPAEIDSGRANKDASKLTTGVAATKRANDEPEPGSTSASYAVNGAANPNGAAALSARASGTASVGTPHREEVWKKAAPLSKKELASVQTLLDTAFTYARPTQEPKNLIKELEKMHLEPIAAQDFNEHTGKMLVVRTESSLEGTRFFHAQFFEDEKKRTFLQHVSFEIRPSPDCMKTGSAMIEKKLGSKLRPVQQSAQYALYQAPGDYIVWIKRLDEEDLGPDPFNSRDPGADVGTCRVALEKDIHAHESH